MQLKTGTELFWNFYSDIKRFIFIIFCIINDCCLELCIQFNVNSVLNLFGLINLVN